MKKTKIPLIILSLLLTVIGNSFAQQEVNLEELKNTYFKDKKYTEFVDYLKSLGAKNKVLEPATSYYIALSRYHQLKYLEEIQNWDEYFSNGNTYRDELTSNAQKTVDSTKVPDATVIFARLLLWQFHKDQQDAFVESSLSELMNSVAEYLKISLDTRPVKEVADKLFSYQEKGKSRELYRIYADRLIASDIKEDELKETALNFHKEGNLELSQIVYDAYIGKISKSLAKEQLIPVLIDIAKSFAYRNENTQGPLYAEKIFKKIEEIGGKEAFDEELMYLRAFNLEKSKDFLLAKDKYIDLAQGYPQSGHLDEANYKIGVIFTYVSKDIKTGREYFQKLSQKEALVPHVISSFYQLGLLSQWENDLSKAKEYYNKLIERSAVGAKDSFSEVVTLAKERLKEIEELKTIEYNLKTFLDVCLKEDAGVGITPNLSASLYILKKETEVKITSNINLPITGCLPVELQYLWSGDLGKTKIAPAELPVSSSFDTSYVDAGTKQINLVVLSSSGVVDCSFDLLDAY